MNKTPSNKKTLSLKKTLPIKKTTTQETSPLVKRAANKKTSPAILQLQGVKKSFTPSIKHAPIEILKNLDFTLRKAEVSAIMGKSGSGKSTLLSIAAGLERVDSGKVIISDENLTSMDEKTLTRFRATNISIIFQQFHLITHLNALDNIRLPLQILGISQDVDKRAREALQQVQLDDRSTHFPHELSGGEQQRLAIARALVVRPNVLLADEPTGNLDQDTGEQVIEQLFNVVKENKVTMLLVTHDEGLAQHCDSIYQLHDGKLVVKKGNAEKKRGNAREKSRATLVKRKALSTSARRG